VDPDRPEGPPTFTPDGRYAVLAEGGDLWRLNLDDPSDVTAVLATEDVIESAPALSPDGGWLAYTSTESGPRQVYLRPFPGNDARGRPVTVDGGLQPVWSPDGRALFYRSGSDIVRVPITGGAVSGAPEPVVTDLERGHEEFDVAPDGRLLITRSHVTADEALLSRRIVIVLNWTEELKRLLPRNPSR
jgi:Tol biopolymer transport system component